MKKQELEFLDDATLLQMHDDIHRIMEARAVNMKARFAAQKTERRVRAPKACVVVAKAAIPERHRT